ncbi:MAG: DUF523 and DUF1722 domain-containing protein [Candidatus Bathyarchaeota archaeon]|nr:DUF523 and DUF1722 domain-containing protein [Candidatus Bathyarchaeota archaeon]
MRSFVKPVVVISKCITFEPVRWDGQIIASKFVEDLKPHAEFIPVCPEVEIGLGVPRETLRIVKTDEDLRLVQPATGLDLTGKMRQFAEKFLTSLPEVDGFILKSGSPSSAMKDAKIYPSAEKSAPVGRGTGFFGGAVLARYSQLAIEDERRLLNSRIKEHFLTKLYTLADFRQVKKAGSIKGLIDFQARNKLLLTAYNQTELHAMGRIGAQSKGKPLKETVADYENHLWRALKHPPRRGANENVLTKAAGYFTSKLSKNEKTFFLDAVAKYRTSKFPLSTPLNLLKSWIIRFNEEYLLQQTFFEPYPDALMEIQSVDKSGEEKDYWK